MLSNIVIDIAVQLFSGLLSLGGHLPVVTALPAINGYDIDTALVQGMGAFNAFTGAFWPLKDLFIGFLAIISYYIIKAVILRFFLGSRTPGMN